MKPSRPCRIRNCPQLTSDKSGYCPAHAKEARDRYDRQRGTATQRGYGAEWRRVRDAYLREHPLCERCDALGLLATASMVHHKDGNPHNNDPSNHMALCAPCHETVTGNRFK